MTMTIADLLRWLEPRVYTDMTEQFAQIAGCDPKSIAVQRFTCGASRRSIQVSIDFPSKFAMFSAEGNTKLTRNEIQWLENALGAKFKQDGKFHSIDLEDD